MLNSRVFRFYSLLVLLYFSDMVLLLSNIWNSLKLTSSPFFLGIVLSIGAALPFILKKTKLIKLKRFLTVSDLYKRRVVVYITLLVIAFSGYSDTKFGFIVTSLSIGYLSLITLSTLESSNAKLVLDGHITSQRASRIMQTLVQTGSFVGALVSGFLLTNLSYNHLIIILCVFDIIVSLFGNKLFTDKFAVKEESIEKGFENSNRDLSKKLKYLSIAIGIIGLHICAFNILTPILFQSIKHLSADYYGMCSGAAGVGAFIAAFVNFNKFRFLIPALTLTISDAIFTFSGSPVISIISCFVVGFSLNTIRINLRKSMIDETEDAQEADLVAKYSATIYTFSQSIGPLVIGILTSKILWGSVSAMYILPLVGASILVFLISLYKGRIS